MCTWGVHGDGLGTASLCGRAPFLRGVPGAAALCPLRLYAGAFTQAPLEAVCPHLCDTLVWLASPGMGSPSHGAHGQPPSGPAIPLVSFQLSHPWSGPCSVFLGATCHFPSLFFAPLLSLCATDGPWQRTWLWLLRRAPAFALPVPPWHHPLHVLFVTQGSFPAGVSDWPLGWVDVCLCTAHCGGWQPGDHPGSLPRLLPCAPAPWMFLSAVSEHRGFENHPAVGDTVEELLHCCAPGAAGIVPALGSSWRLKPWL